MSWKEKIREFGGGDLAFLSEDGEAIIFVVCGEPVLLTGKFKNRPSEKVGCPIITEDGFVLFVAGKRLARKISKYESQFDVQAFIAIRHGEQNEITSSYELKVLDDVEKTKKLLAMKATEYSEELLVEAIVSAEAVMRQ